MSGSYTIETTRGPKFVQLLVQHAGPKLATYSTGTITTTASVHFAQRSRRLIWDGDVT
ncbi:MAG TPA: hypothetical protein VGM05_20050 [Planctomycetaceae bacterium]